jgi:hypothetical protein
MSVTKVNRQPAALRQWMARARQFWKRGRRTVTEIRDPQQSKHIAPDVGASRSEVCILAGKWPDTLLPVNTPQP